MNQEYQSMKLTVTPGSEHMFFKKSIKDSIMILAFRGSSCIGAFWHERHCQPLSQLWVLHQLKVRVFKQAKGNYPLAKTLNYNYQSNESWQFSGASIGSRYSHFSVFWLRTWGPMQTFWLGLVNTSLFTTHVALGWPPGSPYRHRAARSMDMPNAYQPPLHLQD